MRQLEKTVGATPRSRDGRAIPTGPLAVAAGLFTIVVGAEWLHRRASRRGPDGPGWADTGSDGTEAVVVLGYPARHDGTPHPMQRWRCRIASRSMHRDGIVVFTGGAVRRTRAEANVMARYARDVLGIPADRIVTETRARSTWQNIEFSIPLIEHADRIILVSDPMHAARARRYLRVQRPDLAARLAPAADYRPFEQWWLKVPTAAHELAAISRRRAGRALARLYPTDTTAIAAPVTTMASA
ncbi:YdcF family protein [Nocardia sp. alder85J]|uniref:YdcF family protein n=1 Tax=Nocardia sp. alder85J TaxID=2862949 RepID=UPI001CD8153D|nr:YdcF family protein [Nocardia sp. alder85J]MCX4098306.1 YdcF family protein [Nocardia sp. alder85J]